MLPGTGVTGPFCRLWWGKKTVTRQNGHMARMGRRAIMMYSPCNKLLSGHVDHSVSTGESQVSGQNLLMLMKSPSPPLGVCKAARGTSSGVKRGQRFISLLSSTLGRWMVDGNTSGFAHTGHSHFGSAAFMLQLGPAKRCLPKKAFVVRIQTQLPGERDPSLQASGAGKLPCPRHMGLMDGEHGGWGDEGCGAG